MAEELIIRISASAKAFTDEIERLKSKTAKLESGLASVAKVSAAAFAVLTASVGLAISKFASFEKTFTNVQTLLDKSSFSTKSFKDGVDSLRSGVIKLATESGESFDALNKGLFDLVSAGVNADNAIETLSASVALATAGATDTATATKALTAAITSYGSEAGSAQVIAEKFFTAQKYGVTTVGELASEFNKVAGLGKTIGVSFNEILSASTALTNNGAKPTAEAFTEMRGVLNSIVQVQSQLADQSPELQDALDIQNIKQRGLVASLQLASKAIGGNIVKLQTLIPNIRGLSGVLSLTGAQADTFTKIMKGMDNEQERAGTFAEALALKQATTEIAAKKLKAAFDAVVVTIGEQLAPTFIGLANAISGAAQKFNDLDKETIKGIADLIKVATVITGVVTGLSLFGLGAIKVVRTIQALRAALAAGRLAAAAFTGALTFGLTTILAFLPEIISGFKALIGLVSDESSSKQIENTDKKLERLNQTRAELLKQTKEESGINQRIAKLKLEAIDKEIEKTVKLKEELDKQSRKDQLKELYDIDNTIGKLTKRQEELTKAIEGSLQAFPEIRAKRLEEVDAITKQIEEQKKLKQSILDTQKAVTEAPSSKGGGADPNAIRKEQAREAEKIERDSTENILDIRSAQIEGLKAIQNGASKERVESYSREAELISKIDKLEADNRKLSKEEDQAGLSELQMAFNEEELTILDEQLQAVRDKRSEDAETELQRRLEFEELLKELDIEQYEAGQEIQAERDALADERQVALDQKEIEDLRNKLLTKEQIKKKIATDEANREIAARNKFLEDEQKHGTAIAKFNEFFNKEEVKAVEGTNRDLAQLANSKNSTLKGIGKAAALTQIAIDTAKGAVSAYASLASIPLVGPALGAAAAAALIAYGVERAGNVASAQRGGIIQAAGNGALRDRVPSLLEPGELVVPRQLTPDFIQSVGRPDAQAQNNQVEAPEVIISIEDEATDFISARQRENQVLGIGVI